MTLSISSTSVTTPAMADIAARERELSCTDGTVFMGQQVRQGNGSPSACSADVESERLTIAVHAVLVPCSVGHRSRRNRSGDETWGHASGLERK